MVESLRNGLKATSDGAFKLTFGVVVIVAALAITYVDSGTNFRTFELEAIMQIGIPFSGVLLFGALVIPRSKTTANVVLAVVTLGSVFTAYIVHTELFFPENKVALIGICCAALFALFVAFRIIDDLRWGGLTLLAAASISLVVILWPDLIKPQLILGLVTPGGLLGLDSPVMWAGLAGLLVVIVGTLYLISRMVDISRCGSIALLAVVFVGVTMPFWLQPGTRAAGAYYDGGWEDHPKFRGITFLETPNVYFIGFESLVPESIMQKYMGIETTEFHQMFSREARRFRNLFANSAPTKNSFNTLMALDVDIFLSHRKVARGNLSYFAGHALSPLFWIMRENGYEITSVYDNIFFGHQQGPHIDNYIINRKGMAICALLDEDIRLWAFWGYCKITGVEPLQQDSGAFLLQEFARVNGSNPQFVIAHLNMPGHTPLSFDYDNGDNREKFIERYESMSNKAAVYLSQIIQHVKNNDPSAILFMFGDHGTWMSRELEMEEDPTFFLLDRFGILGGVYPRDRCSSYFDEAQRKGFMTTLDAVHAILSCLSGGQSALVEPRHDRFWGYGVLNDREYPYKEFLYE